MNNYLATGLAEGFEQGTGGGLDHVAVHELWHSLSRYLPKEDLIRYKKIQQQQQQQQ